ncbi:MAG: single-stranded DNA-binding protein [Clostridiales bacterium]|nr:single-stranded DNA-binding protein [Clostridiales bacterium]
MLNNVSLQGRLCTDPELKYTQNNIAVLSLRIACDRDFRSNDSNAQTCDFINVVFWRKTAEFVEKYFSKGDMILVQGRLQVRDYTDNDGNRRYVTEVVVDRVHFCGSKRDKGGETNATPRGTNYQDYANVSTADFSGAADFSELGDDDGELPF